MFLIGFFKLCNLKYFILSGTNVLNSTPFYLISQKRKSRFEQSTWKILQTNALYSKGNKKRIQLIIIFSIPKRH